MGKLVSEMCAGRWSAKKMFENLTREIGEGTDDLFQHSCGHLTGHRGSHVRARVNQVRGKIARGVLGVAIFRQPVFLYEREGVLDVPPGDLGVAPDGGPDAVEG